MHVGAFGGKCDLPARRAGAEENGIGSTGDLDSLHIEEIDGRAALREVHGDSALLAPDAKLRVARLRFAHTGRGKLIGLAELDLGVAGESEHVGDGGRPDVAEKLLREG